MFGKTKEKITAPARNVASIAVCALVIAITTMLMCLAFVVGQGVAMGVDI